MLKKIIKFFKKEEPEYPYPDKFVLVTLTRAALELGVNDNRNKVIKYLYINKYGNRSVESYPFSEERVDNYRKKGIPIVDKTKQEINFPIYSTVNPSEVSFHR